MKRLAIVAWALLAAVSVPAETEPPLITDRPDRCDAPFVLPRGLFQIEGGAFHGERDEAGETLTTRAFPSALLRFGVTETFELRFGVPGMSIETTDSANGETRETGLVDATLGLKIRIAEQRGAVPHTAFVGSLTVPSGDDDLSSDRVDPGFRFAFGNSLSDTVSITYNVGAFWLTERNDAGELDTRSFFDWAVTTGVSLTPEVAVFGEFFGVAAMSAERRPVNAAGAGVTYLITPRIQLDGRMTFGLSSAALDWSAGMGVSYRFPRFKG